MNSARSVRIILNRLWNEILKNCKLASPMIFMCSIKVCASAIPVINTATPTWENFFMQISLHTFYLYLTHTFPLVNFVFLVGSLGLQNLLYQQNKNVSSLQSMNISTIPFSFPFKLFFAYSTWRDLSQQGWICIPQG